MAADATPLLLRDQVVVVCGVGLICLVCPVYE